MELSFFDMEALEKLNTFEEGCPVCIMKKESIGKTVYTILYELVNDSGVRKRFDEEGLCNEHAQLMVKIARNFPELGGLGPAIIFKDIMERLVEYMEKVSSKRVIRSSGCYLCKVEREFERVYVKTYAKVFKFSEGRQKYEMSKTTFCFDHAQMILRELSRDRKSFEWFKKIQTVKYREIVRKLEIYIEKHDYRKNGIPFGDEVHAWKLSAKILGKGKF